MKKTAFTLIELLVVIAIIGILATLAIVSLQQARQNARNAKRVADLRQMQTALALYFNDNNSYPSLEEFEVGSPLISSSTGKILMHQIPSAPAVADGDCLTSDYTYTVNSDNSSYKLKTCISKSINNLEAGIITVTPSSLGYLNACDNQTEFTDARDGTTYQIVAIGDQCWMAENLKYENGCSNNEWISDTVDAAWCGCYNDNLANCDTYGRLYQWSAAMDGDIDEGSQGLCPKGFYIPTDSDFKELEGFVDSVYGVDDLEWDGFSWRGSDVSYKLKASSSDNPSWNGDNFFRFNAVASGYLGYGPVFTQLGSNAYFWTSSPSDPTKSWYRSFGSSNSLSSRSYNRNVNAYTIRCIMN